MASAGFAILTPDGSKFSSTPQSIQTSILESILVAAFTIATVLTVVPCDYVNGDPVPTIVFKGLPSTFHAFVVSLIFAFAGALSALLIRDRSLIAKFCECTSMVSMASALALFLWAVLRN